MSPEEQKKAERKQEIEDVKELMSTRAGRRFAYRLLATCKIFQSSYTGNADTYFKEGRRAVGLEFFDDITMYCFDDFCKARTENQPKGE